ncbi:transposase [Streptomyces antimycoticus]|uniref:transposase n=1 Tax=Streptomyces antimycoticus TaxID=68175 RepID=UPI001D15DF2A
MRPDGRCRSSSKGTAWARHALQRGHVRLDIPQARGNGTTVAAEGTHMDTYLDNLLAETSVRYGKPRGIAYHHICDTYIALFTHFIPCGVRETVHIIEGLLKNTSEVKPSTVHADTQGQSQPVFALAHLLGFDLMPRIRNWKGLTFYRPSKPHRVRAHRRAVRGAWQRTIDWDLTESQFRDLVRVAISVREGAISSSTLLKRLHSGSRKNATYTAFRQVGRVIRTVQLLRYLSDAPLRRRVTATTNKVEAYNGFSPCTATGHPGPGKGPRQRAVGLSVQQDSRPPVLGAADAAERALERLNQALMDEGATLRRAAVDAEHLQKRLRKAGRILAKVTVPADDVVDAEIVEDNPRG